MLADIPHYLFAVLGIGFIIFIHELGHYLAARAVGIRVEAFSIGFGKRLFGWTRGATEYKVCLIPLGGYVKMAGEDPTKPTTGRPDEFGSKKVWQRVLVISAGVIMNMIFALVVLPIAFTVGIPFEEPVIGEVTPGGPAWEAGIKSGDRVLRINDRRVLGFDDILYDMAVATGPVPVSVERGGRTIELSVTPKEDAERGLPMIGVLPASDWLIEADALSTEDKEGAALAVAMQLQEKGLHAGDLVAAVNGIPVSNGLWSRREIRRAHYLRAPMALTVVRDETRLPAPIVLDPVFEDADGWEIGVIAGGPVIAKVLPGSPVAQMGLEEGDLVVRINGAPLSSPSNVALLLGGGLSVFAERADPPEDPVVRVSVVRDNPESGSSVRELAHAFATWHTRQEFVDSLVFAGTESRNVWVRPGGPASKGGLRTGDALVAIDGVDVADFDTLREAVSQAEGATMAFRVKRNGHGETLQLQITPARKRLNVALNGVVTPRILRATVTVPFAESFEVGLVQTRRIIIRIVQTLRSIVGGRVAAKNLGGIITIFRASKTTSKIGLMRGLLFLAMVSINLAILNILPIPVLDGGWLVFLIIEKIKGSPISEGTMAYFQWAGLIFILGLMVFVTWNDVARLIEGV